MEFVSMLGTPNRGRPYSPPIAARVRPGGSHSFSEPMRFDPIAGGWISESQFNSTGVHSPGTKEEGGNGNLRSGAPAVTIKEEPAPGSKSYGITLGPTEMLLMQSQEKNPFSFPSYWDEKANTRGWYDKPGEPVPVGNTTWGRPL